MTTDTATANAPGQLPWPKDSLLGRMNAWAASLEPFDVSTANYHVAKQATCDAPQVSIVTRTQGKRSWGVTDVLACLSNQTCPDFELVLVAHNAAQADFDALIAQVEAAETALDLGGRITIVKLDGGGRSHPLNVGFACARGNLVSIIDDDDLMLDTFVQTMVEGAEQHPASMLYAHVYTQTWELRPEESAKGESAMRPFPVSDLSTQYCHAPNTVEQFTENHAPIQGWAFPRYVFSQVGIQFDESLEVLEDWNFIMRASNVCGYAVVPQPVAIYRFWYNEQSSHTLHDEDFWRNAKQNLQEALNAAPVLLPEGSAFALSEAGRALHLKHEGIQPEQTLEWPDLWLFFDTGDGFNGKQSMHPEPGNALAGGTYTFTFSDMESHGAISKVRLDPAEHGGISVSNLALTAYLADGGTQTFAGANALHNGTTIANGTVVFLKDDPQFIFTLSAPSAITRIVVTFEAHLVLSNDEVDAAIDVLAERKFADHVGAERRALDAALARANKANRVAWRVANHAIGWEPGSIE